MELTFSCTLKEKSHDKYLQSCHRYHQKALHHAKIEYPVLRALDSTHITVLSCPEIFLIAVDCRQIAGYFENGFLKSGCLFGGGALFAGKAGGFGFIFNLGNADFVSELDTRYQGNRLLGIQNLQSWRYWYFVPKSRNPPSSPRKYSYRC